ncbi:acyl-CoA synthetase [Sandaracinobacteroides sp. A072]|uniref:acyl-CoA synthetase n=1 Tax=Sandaracinobacteroides sp. A072 TaxID=3461146 RepID=UPI0040412DA7
MELTQGLHRSARLRPDSIATVDGTRTRNWRQVRADVACLAALFRANGITVGDRIAVLAHNSDHFFDCYFACFWAGAIIVPLNTRLSVAELAFQLSDVGASLLLVGDGFAAQAEGLASELPGLAMLALDEAGGSLRARAAALAPIKDAARADQDIAGIFYTGGTTGRPKGVMLTHRNLVSVASNLIMMIGFDESCINLHAAPMFHLADIGLFSVTMVAGTHVFAPRLDAASLLPLAARHRVTHLFTVPAVIDQIARSGHAALDLGALRMLGYGGSPMPQATYERVRATLPDIQLIQGFGMTEMPSLTFLLPRHHQTEDKLRSVGIPGYGYDARVVDANGRELPRGQTGEIVGRGPCVMAGYWNRPAETAEALRGGWMHSQDAGYMDEDGFLYITDRLKDMIVSGAENIYSIEVENALGLHPAIRECAVIGVPDDRWGERVHAIIVPNKGMAVDDASIAAHLEGRLARYKWPKSLELRETPLPRSPIGKILKADLRKPHWAGRDRQV